MNQPHKLKDVIIAWANGEEIEFLDPGFSTDWIEIDSPNWLEDVQYRVKPKKEIRYCQVALFKGVEYYTVSANDKESAKGFESNKNFITWITDPIHYQVEKLD